MCSVKKTGVLLVNLGTPDAPTVSAVRRYLREFLSDPLVIDLPALPRYLLLYGLILPFRPRRSKAAYEKIWTQAGSPLLLHSKRLTTALADELGDHFVVALGMRYGNPSLQCALERLKAHDCQRVIVFPLFPQYSSAVTGSVIAKVKALLRGKGSSAEVSFINDFFNDPGYVDCLAEVVRENNPHQKTEHAIFSYHGLPERHLDKSASCLSRCDREKACPVVTVSNRGCYRAQCYETSRLLAQNLGLTDAQYTVAFQSRLGKTQWIKPYTDLSLTQLAARGVKNVTVICPSFVADCLETLEEMGFRARQQWMALEGECFHLIPCLNAGLKWVKVVADVIRER